MKNRFKTIYLLLIVAVLSLTVACGNQSEDSSSDSEKDSTEEASNESGDSKQDEENNNGDSSNEESDEEDSGMEEVEFTEEGSGPDDQGDMEVWLDGKITMSKDEVIVKGQTNLLPDSRIKLIVEAEDSILIGTNDQVQIKSSGEFELKTGLPDDVDSVLHAEIRFDPTYAKTEIEEHYVDNIKGKFLRLESDLDEVYPIVAYRQSHFISDGKKTYDIEAPNWEVPEDQGDPNIWIEPKIGAKGDYLVINLKSNLVEHTSLKARASIPNYITTGYQGVGYTNPDGSATLYVPNPEKDDRIEGLEKYSIDITMDPSNSRNTPNVIEAYGENGENLQGDLVQKEDDGKIIVKTLHINVK